MTKQEFAAPALAMEQTLYRVSASLLRRECDREETETVAQRVILQ